MVAVVARKTSFVNADGLVIYYGTNEAVVTRGGEYSRLADGRHCVTVSVSLPGLPTVASTNVQILEDTLSLPNGAFIEQVDVLVTKETAGANANFNLGLVNQDRATQIDFDGLLAAADAFNGGTDLGTLTLYNVGTTEVGALVGTKITSTGLLVGWADTADFTAGVLRIRVFYSIPLAADL